MCRGSKIEYIQFYIVQAIHKKFPLRMSLTVHFGANNKWHIKSIMFPRKSKLTYLLSVAIYIRLDIYFFLFVIM